MSSVLKLLRGLCRVIILIYLVTFVLLSFMAGSYRIYLTLLAQALAAIMPESISGILVMPTIFGGSLRLDFALFVVLLLALDWMLSRLMGKVR